MEISKAQHLLINTDCHQKLLVFLLFPLIHLPSLYVRPEQQNSLLSVLKVSSRSRRSSVNAAKVEHSLAAEVDKGCRGLVRGEGVGGDEFNWCKVNGGLEKRRIQYQWCTDR